MAEITKDVFNKLVADKIPYVTDFEEWEGIGEAGELCCEDCPDIDGSRSGGGLNIKCGSVTETFEVDGVEVDILLHCDGEDDDEESVWCDCAITQNRAILMRFHDDEEHGYYKEENSEVFTAE